MINENLERLTTNDIPLFELNDDLVVEMYESVRKSNPPKVFKVSKRIEEFYKSKIDELKSVANNPKNFNSYDGIVYFINLYDKNYKS